MKKTAHRSPKAPHQLRFAVLATDSAVFTVHDSQLCVRLIPVHLPPYFSHMHGLPGGLVAPDETAEQAALRHVTTKGGLVAAHVHLEQLATFSAIHRDPRGRVVSVGYLGLAPWESLSEKKEFTTDDATWCPVNNLPALAYDHRHIITTALERLKARATYTTLLSKLMPHEFTLTELEHMYESVLGRDIDKRNFRKKILKLNVLQPLARQRRGDKWRPAKLYRFRRSLIEQIEVL